MFIFILSLAALFIAGCAAFFSIKGLTVLFAGSALSVGIMASSLEFGKLVAASYLHRQWKTISFALKTYLCIAVAILMMITSLGIFGFLTKAYQEHRTTVVGYETQLKGVETQEIVLREELAANQVRVDALNTVRKDQEIRVTQAGNYKAPREAAYKAIAEANKELADKEAIQTELRKRIGELEIRKTEISQDLNTKTDVGSFQFVAKALGTDTDTAVKIFILSLVFVFDPLAVSLILALNQLLEEREIGKKISKNEDVAQRLQTKNVNEHIQPKWEEAAGDLAMQVVKQSIEIEELKKGEPLVANDIVSNIPLTPKDNTKKSFLTERSSIITTE
jgi:hypothetical protein